MRLHPLCLARGTCLERRLRLRPLAACLALAYASVVPAAGGHLFAHASLFAGRDNRSARLAHPSAETAGVTHVVTTCDDPLPVPLTCAETIDGTVRQGFLCAQNGDTIDLTQLVCSTITLSAPLVAGPGTLTLNGPGQDKLTIDAAGQFQALVHNAGPDDSLFVNGLTIANGHYDNPPAVRGGGCISSTGNVSLSYSAVSSCYVSGSAYAAGGGIDALGAVSLYRSSVTGNTAHSNGDGGGATGGGIQALNLELYRSTVSGNTASYTGRGRAIGGGVVALTVHANYSTISGNGAATAYAGIYTDNAYLFNSTVSGNHADNGPVGGVYAFYGAQIFNSTIAENTGKGGAFAAGLNGGFALSPASILQSTIVANNSADGVELDVESAFGPVLGSNNLIMAHSAGTTVPADTISADPKLGPLQDNGGPTLTHALLPGSPAIDAGSAAAVDLFDQRGVPRVEGSAADIGAFESDRLFSDDFDP